MTGSSKHLFRPSQQWSSTMCIHGLFIVCVHSSPDGRWLPALDVARLRGGGCPPKGAAAPTAEGAGVVGGEPAPGRRRPDIILGHRSLPLPPPEPGPQSRPGLPTPTGAPAAQVMRQSAGGWDRGVKAANTLIVSVWFKLRQSRRVCDWHFNPALKSDETWQYPCCCTWTLSYSRVRNEKALLHNVFRQANHKEMENTLASVKETCMSSKNEVVVKSHEKFSALRTISSIYQCSRKQAADWFAAQNVD